MSGIICEGLSLSIFLNRLGSSGLEWIWYELHHDTPPPLITSTTTSTHVLFVTSSAAPSFHGLPFWDGEGEQRRGLREEELSGNARLHETLQPAHHSGRSAYVEVRQTLRCMHKLLNRPNLQSRPKQSSHGYIRYQHSSVFCALILHVHRA